jgi:hypothetical protein
MPAGGEQPDNAVPAAVAKTAAAASGFGGVA